MKWYIYHQWGNNIFVDCYEGETAQEAKAAFKKKVKWAHETKILTIRKAPKHLQSKH